MCNEKKIVYTKSVSASAVVKVQRLDPRGLSKLSVYIKYKDKDKWKLQADMDYWSALFLNCARLPA